MIALVGNLWKRKRRPKMDVYIKYHNGDILKLPDKRLSPIYPLLYCLMSKYAGFKNIIPCMKRNFT